MDVTETLSHITSDAVWTTEHVFYYTLYVYTCVTVFGHHVEYTLVSVPSFPFSYRSMAVFYTIINFFQEFWIISQYSYIKISD